MQHTAESYLEAAKGWVHVAERLHSELQEYGAAHHSAGLAVECLLRAYRLRLDPEFDSRHDLKALLKAARFHDFVPPEQQAQVTADLMEVWRRWRNDHRYLPARLLQSWLRDQKLDRDVKGDRLKESSRLIVNAAIRLVQLGDRRWPSSKT